MITIKKCGNCSHWQSETAKGYECHHSGPYGGNFANKEKYPYCQWERLTKFEIKKRKKSK